jgi:hypothetical protein
MADTSSTVESATPEAAVTPAPSEVSATTPEPATTQGKEGDASASPSEARTGETKETLLEAVLRAVDKDKLDEGDKKDTIPTEESPTSSEGAPSPEKTRFDLSKDPTPEELATYKEGTRQRIQQLLEQRNTLRNDAQVTQTLRDYLVVNDIAKEDFQLTLDLAAAMRRGDFRGFLEGVAPYVNLATQALGITLPPDLYQSVQQGGLSFEAAAQISRERYARALAEQRATRVTQIATHQADTAAREGLSQSIEQTVNQWEATIRANDPDYGRKEATVKNLLWAVVQERGAPQTPEQAVEIAREAYNRANETIRSFTPSPRATQRVPSSINRAAGGARPEPKSMMEAAMLGLERARSSAR